MSQLLTRLEQEILSVSDPDTRAVLAAKRACYLARVGRFAEAQSQIKSLRDVYGDGRNGLVTAWIILAEGLLGLFEQLSSNAFDRVFRAQFLGVALKEPELLAVASAWKAHFEFETSKFPAMVQSLKTSLASSLESNHDALARASTVMFNALMVCGDRVDAQRWFLRGQDHAVRNGDRAGIDALVYNRAAFGTAWLRAARCMGPVHPELVSSSRMAVNSARNLQSINGVAAFAHLIDLIDARLLILEERFVEAVDKLKSIRLATPFADYNFSQALIDFEVGYCWFRIGDRDRTVESMTAAGNPDFSELDVDDQLVAAWIKHELASANDGFGDAVTATQQLTHCISRYLQTTDELRSLLAPLKNS